MWKVLFYIVSGCSETARRRARQYPQADSDNVPQSMSFPYAIVRAAIRAFFAIPSKVRETRLTPAAETLTAQVLLTFRMRVHAALDKGAISSCLESSPKLHESMQPPGLRFAPNCGRCHTTANQRVAVSPAGGGYFRLIRRRYHELPAFRLMR